MGRKTTQRIRIGTTSGRLPRVQELLDHHAARTPWPPWAQKALYVVGAALVVLSLAAMLGTAFQDSPRLAAAAQGEQ